MAFALSRNRFVLQHWVLLGIIGLMSVIYLCQEIFGPSFYGRWMPIPVVVVESWNRLLAGSMSTVDWQHLSTMFSSAFLHGGLDHILLNMVFLWLFGALLTELLGKGAMIAIFIFTALTASLGQVLLNLESYVPFIGASGVVMGFEGAYFGLALRYALPDPHVWPLARPVAPIQLVVFAAIGVIYDLSSIAGASKAGIAYGAHIGGFIGGLALALLLLPCPKSAQRRI